MGDALGWPDKRMRKYWRKFEFITAECGEWRAFIRPSGAFVGGEEFVLLLCRLEERYYFFLFVISLEII